MASGAVLRSDTPSHCGRLRRDLCFQRIRRLAPSFSRSDTPNQQSLVACRLSASQKHWHYLMPWPIPRGLPSICEPLLLCPRRKEFLEVLILWGENWVFYDTKADRAEWWLPRGWVSPKSGLRYKNCLFRAPGFTSNVLFQGVPRRIHCHG